MCTHADNLRILAHDKFQADLLSHEKCVKAAEALERYEVALKAYEQREADVNAMKRIHQETGV